MRSLMPAALASALIFSPALSVAYELNILHINDHHSHLQANRLDLQLAGQRTRVSTGGFARLKAAFDELGARRPNLLKLHAGDAITGDLFYTLFKGEADAALMNTVCFDAFALGNHEFDDGDAGLARFLAYLKQGPCNTPVLAANVKPEVGVSPLAKHSATDYLQPSVIIERGGERIGVIGIDIVSKTVNSSSPDPSTRFLDESRSAQAEIDSLRSAGVEKIVLLTHYQYRNDLQLARALSGVDVIVGGDSHTLLGSAFAELGLNPGGEYPSVVLNRDGDKVCVVQAWEYANVIGELTVRFDGDRVAQCKGRPHLLLANSFKRKNKDGKRVELEGPERNEVLMQVAAHKNLRITGEDEFAATVLAGFTGKVEAMKADVIGTTRSTLCLERIPGQGKSRACDKAQTAARGSDISNLVAKAFLRMSKTSHVAVQNGGGVRVDLLQGPVTIGDAYSLLPFANTLTELDMTGAELHGVLEEALDYALSKGGSTGAYPYAAGLRWHVDASKAMGQRISKLEVNPRVDGAWRPLDPMATYKVVTNSYIAGGKDGYKTFGTVSKRGDALDTYLDYAHSFVDYVREVGTLDKLPVSEYSTQSFINREGVRQ